MHYHWKKIHIVHSVHIRNVFMYYTYTSDLQYTANQPFTVKVHTTQHGTHSTTTNTDEIRRAKTTQWITRKRQSLTEFVCKDYAWTTAKLVRDCQQATWCPVWCDAVIWTNGRHGGQRHSNPNIQPWSSPKPKNPATIQLQPSL